MAKRERKDWRSEKGALLIEYALLICFSIMCLSAMASLRAGARFAINRAADAALGGGNQVTPPTGPGL